MSTRKQRQRATRAVAAAAAVTLTWGTLGSTIPSAAVVAPHAAEEHDVLDARTGLVTPPPERRAALAALIGDRGSVTWDHRFGTPRAVYAQPGKALSTAYPAADADNARSFLRRHADAFGLADVDSLQPTGRHSLPGGVATVVSFAQSFDGVTATRGGHLSVIFNRDGRVTGVVGSISPEAAAEGSFRLGPAEALAKAAQAVDPGLELDLSRIGSKAGFTEFTGVGRGVSSYVRKAAFPTADGVRVAYRALVLAAPHRAFDTVVDAETGELLFLSSLVQHDAEGTVYENYPGAPGGGRPVIKSFGPTEQSPSGYVDPTGLAGLPGPTTFGNNANTYANWSNFLVPADQAPRPVSPTAQFNYAFADNWGRSKCAVPSYAQDVDPAVTNLFYHHNRIHDEFYRLGFTESAGNFQTDGGDPILGLAQAGAATGGAPLYTGRDNAYMLTLPDGIPPWSGMFLWEPINDAFEGPCRDGDFDAAVIEHEYAHGLTNRYVGPEDNGLNTHQSGAMGEGWGDWYALNYLHRERLSTTSDVGGYATGNTERGIRNWSYDDNPVTFGDIGYDLVGAQVHADGEIWAGTLWEMRKNLVALLGDSAGGSVAEHIVTDAMPLSPTDPSMLDMRDAIMFALAQRYHRRADFAQLQRVVYDAFAARGMGVGAANHETEDGPLGGNDIDPVPSFEHLDAARNGTIRGTVVNRATGEPVAGAKVILGEFEARVSPTAVTGSDGTFQITAVAGEHPVTVQARGFGARTMGTVTVTAGRASTATYSLTPNLASLANGAEIGRASSTSAKQAFDDTEGTSWKTPVGGDVVVELAKPATIEKVVVSGYTSSRFEGLKSFTLQTSTDGKIWHTQPIGEDAFGYAAPRPVAPDLHYRTFTLPKGVKASHIRFWADAAQGETKANVQIGDVQVFGKGVTGVEPLPPKPLDPDHTESFTIVGGDPAGDNIGGGVTATEFAETCQYPPASQGLDGWVTKLPEDFGDGAHKVSVTGSGLVWDLDLYFYDAECNLVGSVASSSADESGTIPSGSAYVVTANWVGAAVDVTLLAQDTQ